MEWLLVLHMFIQGTGGMGLEIRTSQTAGTENECRQIANFINLMEYAENRDGTVMMTAKAYCSPVHDA